MRRKVWVRSRVLALALAGCVLVACGSEEPSTDPGERPASTAELRIVEPTIGQVVSGDEVTVRLELQGARITDQVTTDITPDQGHIHLKLDGETITLLGGLQEQLTGLSPGPHALEVEFVAADHGFFNPRVLQVVTFAVE
jgi:hypothetical protein